MSNISKSVLKNLLQNYAYSLCEVLNLEMLFRSIAAYAVAWLAVSPSISRFESAYAIKALQLARWEIESPHADFVVNAFLVSWFFLLWLGVILKYLNL